MRRLRADLAGVAPSPVERLLADRVALTWLHLHTAEALAVEREGQLTLAQLDYHGRRCERLHRQFLAAAKALALVRRLQVPALLAQINVAAGPQLNIVD
jgi:hypothetical protein